MISESESESVGKSRIVIQCSYFIVPLPGYESAL